MAHLKLYLMVGYKCVYLFISTELVGLVLKVIVGITCDTECMMFVTIKQHTVLTRRQPIITANKNVTLQKCSEGCPSVLAYTKTM